MVEGVALTKGPNPSAQVDQVGPVQPVSKNPLLKAFLPPLVASRWTILAAEGLFVTSEVILQLIQVVW